MEGVEVEAAVGVPHLVDEAHTLVEDVQVVDLEAVHHLLGKHDPLSPRVLGGVAQVIDASLPLVFCRAPPGEHAEGDLVWAAENG